MKLFFSTLSLFIFSPGFAQAGTPKTCSLSLAKKMVKSLAELELKNNGKLKQGKLSFKMRSNNRAQTYEFTEEFVSDKIENGLMSEQYKEPWRDMLVFIQENPSTKIYRVKMRFKEGQGKCSYGAICTGYDYRATFSQTDDGRCFLDRIEDEPIFN